MGSRLGPSCAGRVAVGSTLSDGVGRCTPPGWSESVSRGGVTVGVTLVGSVSRVPLGDVPGLVVLSGVEGSGLVVVGSVVGATVVDRPGPKIGRLGALGSVLCGDVPPGVVSPTCGRVDGVALPVSAWVGVDDGESPCGRAEPGCPA
ncbi:hypothetical protein [Nocardia wallacei]|uniref:hypothetical protein n=1 Tax=Nocardia wallacei TaxID=480035 RepID=UPI0024552C81|nr:hypothetical protein [Nocardia wallacei]